MKNIIRMEVVGSFDYKPGVHDIDVTRYGRHDVIITPEVAQQLIDLGGNPRIASMNRAKSLEREMETGTFHSHTTDAIATTTSGRLANGQHRLIAVVRTGVTIQMPLATGIDDAAMKSIDSGWKRRLDHRIDFPVNRYVRLYSGSIGVWKQKRDNRVSGGVTVFQAERFNYLFGDIACHLWPAIGSNSNILRSALMYPIMEYAIVSMERAYIFLDALSNIDDHSNHAADKLRNWILYNKNSGSNGARAHSELFHRAVYCMTKDYLDEQINQIRPSNGGVLFDWPWIKIVNEHLEKD